LLLVARRTLEEGKVTFSFFCFRARFSRFPGREGFFSGIMIPPTSSYITIVTVAV
jgi:hypothetical protein